MLTDEERIRALIGNLKQWDWHISPVFMIEKEDAEALLKVLSDPVQSMSGEADKN